jgi:hypothetical protein
VLLSSACVQPVVASAPAAVGLQASVEQLAPSLHTLGVGVSLQPVVALHVATVQVLPSTSHTESTGVWVTVPVVGSHVSVVHAIESSTAFAACSH